MEETKLNPLQMVALEVSEHCSMKRDELERATSEVLEHLRKRAQAALDEDSTGDDALSFSLQYQAVSEIVLYLGSQLIAFEDIDHEIGTGFGN